MDTTENSIPTVTTDLLDYAPGATATITAENFIVGSTLEFQVLHLDAGPDGEYGTDDDVIVETSGEGHGPWTVTDGGEGDLDEVANGTVVTEWYVNPDDSEGATFLLTATDTATGEQAETNFTDAKPAEPEGGFVTSPHVGDFEAWRPKLDDWSTAGAPEDSSGYVEGDVIGLHVHLDDLRENQEWFILFGLDLNRDANGAFGFSDSTDIANATVNGVNVSDYILGKLGLTLGDLSTASGHGFSGFNVSAVASEFIGFFDEAQTQYDVGGNAPQNLAGGFLWWKVTFTPDDGDGDPTEDISLDLFVGGIVANDGAAINADAVGEPGYKVYAVIPATVPVDEGASQVGGVFQASLSYGDKTLNFKVEDDDDGTPPQGTVITIDKVTVCGTTSAETVADDFAGGSDNLMVLAGNALTWIYKVTGDGAITGVAVDDDQLADADDPVYLSGDSNNNNVLDADEVWYFYATGIAQVGPYENIGEVSGTGEFALTAEDASAYFGLNPHITLVKLTNGSDGPDLLEGQAITWTYDVINDGNVDLTGLGVSDNPAQTITAIEDLDGFNIGDIDQDGVLNVGETWHYQATGFAGSTYYSNTATATTDDVTDDCDDSVTPTATDDSSYTGHAAAKAGLTKGYWSTHLTEWDVVTTDNNGKTELNPAPQYDWNKSGGITTSPVVTSGPASGKGAVSGANNGNGDSGLLLGDLNHNGLADDDQNLFFDLASAQLLANSSVSGDARIILGSQAIAAQLNEYAGHVLYGNDTSPNGLINEAVKWLKGEGDLSDGASNVNWSTANDLATVLAIINTGNANPDPNIGTNDYTISGSSIVFKSAPLSSSSPSWQQFQLVLDDWLDVFDLNNNGSTVDTVDVYANGEGLKNALAAYNHGLSGTQGFVVSQDGSLIGWQDSIGGTPYDVIANDPGAFWGILADVGITGVAVDLI